jgi:hypothetical protein
MPHNRNGAKIDVSFVYARELWWKMLFCGENI